MGKRIGCIIDDDQIYLTGISKLIQIHKLCEVVHIYKHGKEAMDGLLGLLSKPNLIPDVILLDLNMPIMDGWEFLEEFTKHKFDLPKKITIYIVSSSIDPADLERAKKYNEVTDYVIKPVNTTLLKEIFS